MISGGVCLACHATTTSQGGMDAVLFLENYIIPIETHWFFSLTLHLRKYSLNLFGVLDSYTRVPLGSNGPLSHSRIRLSLSFLAHSFVTLSSSPSLSIVRSPSLSTAHYIPIYRDSPAITRFLLLCWSVRRPVRVANTSKATAGRIRGLVPTNTVATNQI